jgi:hypothetical protein
MIYRALVITIPLSLLFILFGCKDDLIIQRFCTERPSIPLSRILFKLTTDIVSEKDVTIDESGYFSGHNFEVEENGIRKNANISGYLCKDLSFTADITYNDTANTSKLRMVGDRPSGNLLSGLLFYSPNTPNEPGYVRIGTYNGFYFNNSGYGTFITPLFSGEFSYTSFE